MFTLRFARGSSSRSASKDVLRAFSSTPVICRTPSLADITPEGATSFEAKQRVFRAQLAELQKKKLEASKLAIEIVTFLSYRIPSSLAPNALFVSNARTHTLSLYHYNCFSRLT
jgi:hypothetical protein